MIKKLSIRDWLLLAAFCGAAPFVNFYIQLYFSLLAMPALPSTRSYAVLFICFLAADIVGASIAAAILAAPLAWLVNQRPAFLAAVLAIGTTIVSFATWEGKIIDLAT